MHIRLMSMQEMNMHFSCASRKGKQSGEIERYENEKR